MLIRIKKASDVRPSEITPESTYLNRRRFLETAAVAGAGAAFLGLSLPGEAEAKAGVKLAGIVKSPFSTDEKPNSYKDVTTYNNFYEFGTGKGDPVDNAKNFNPKPWTVEIAGAAKKTGTFDFEDIIRPHKLEERIYRFRCVEAWSMIVPWVGVPLADVIKRFEPTSGAKFVAFETLNDPERMPGQRRRVLQWPYREGLRMDEAMHPLTLLAVGLYGEELPNQNGAPIRLIVPWKYGFKSIKSIVTIRFTDEVPYTTWNAASPREYGFYSNVNPDVDHPRWSQSRERRIGEFLRRETLMFNGYADEVASLYTGMDMTKNY